MDNIAFDAFWSYAHDDDDKSGGKVRQVAQALEDEFSLVTGDDLQLFLDRKSLKWGDVWRERVEEAIGEVPFFIPIITPKFLKSDECRRELVKFSGEAKSRGMDALLLPILYIDVQGLTEDNPDEVLALIARTQYVDWTKFRLLDPSDSRVQQAVNDLALRIRDLKQEVTTTSLAIEGTSATGELTELDETLAEIELRLPDWMKSVEFDPIAGKAWNAYRDERAARVERLRSSNASRGAIYSTWVKLGQELLPIAQDRAEKAKTYARLSIELDPLITKAIRLIKSHPERSADLNPVRDGVNEAYLNIEPPERIHDHGWNLPEYLRGANTHLEEAGLTMDESFKHSNEGNAVVGTWRDKLRELDGDGLVIVR